MAELPEIVRQRLARQADGEHPDPDLLTAFAEGALGEREQTQVLAHLGACAACREVVSLALPETPAPQAAPAPVQSGWLRWPVLRWGAAAAAVVVVGAAVMTRETPRAPVMDGGSAASLAKHDENAAAKPQLHDREIRAEAKDEVVAKTKAGVPKEGRRDKIPAAAEPRKQAETVAVRRAAPVGAKDSVQANAVAEAQQQRAQTAAQERSQIVPQQQAEQLQAVPADQQAFQAGAAAGKLQQAPLSMTQQAAPAARAAQAATPPAAPPPARVRQNVVTADRAEAAAPTAAAVEVTAEKGAGRMKSQRPLPARWRISTKGNVERSLDAGGTWRVVPVQEGASFRAVSASDGDVWVGGAAGALYHSSDGGQNWSRVAFANSEITRVEFTDALHGVVSTASGETSVTADGGRTWTVRRP